MTVWGHNFRMSDINCALGESQVHRLKDSIKRRTAIADRYDDALRTRPGVTPLTRLPDRQHAFHLYVIRLEPWAFPKGRDAVFAAMLSENIGVNVHYLPVHMHAWYRDRLSSNPPSCPRAASAFDQIITLPMFPMLSQNDQNDVIRAVDKVMLNNNKRL